MSQAGILLRTHGLTVRRTLRNDPRTRTAALLGLLVALAAGVRAGVVLTNAVQQWHAVSVALAEARLWPLCLLSWAGLGAVAALSVHLHGFANQRATLLLMLPITPAARLRTLWGLAFLDGTLLWLLLTLGVWGSALLPTLGWRALLWLALLVAGAGIAVWWVVAASVLPRLWRRDSGAQRTDLASVLSVLLLMVALWGAAWAWKPAPEIALLMLVPTLLLMGPLAAPTGRLYGVAYTAAQGRAGSHSLGTDRLTRVGIWLVRPTRTLAGALLLRGLLRQSRRWLTWLRMLVILALIASFPLVRDWLALATMPDQVLVVGFVATLALLVITDCATSPIGGEGNRLALFLTAPLSIRELLWAKLLVFLVPTLLPGALLALLLGTWVGLPLSAMLPILAATSLILVGSVTIITWGSAWDADLGLTFASGMAGVVYEEAPVTPQRVGLLTLAGLLLLGQAGLIWHLPALLALAAIALLTGLVSLLAWHIAHCALRRVRA